MGLNILVTQLLYFCEFTKPADRFRIPKTAVTFLSESSSKYKWLANNIATSLWDTKYVIHKYRA